MALHTKINLTQFQWYVFSIYHFSVCLNTSQAVYITTAQVQADYSCSFSLEAASTPYFMIMFSLFQLLWLGWDADLSLLVMQTFHSELFFNPLVFTSKAWTKPVFSIMEQKCICFNMLILSRPTLIFLASLTRGNLDSGFLPPFYPSWLCEPNTRHELYYFITRVFAWGEGRAPAGEWMISSTSQEWLGKAGHRHNRKSNFARLPQHRAVQHKEVGGGNRETRSRLRL